MSTKRKSRAVTPLTIEGLVPQQRPKTEAAKTNNIRNWRLFKGVATHQELAERTALVDQLGKGINRVTLSRLESGEMRYNEDQITLIAAALKVAPRDLIGTNPYHAGDIFAIYARVPEQVRRKIVALALEAAQGPKGK